MKRLFILLASLLFFITVDAQIPRFPLYNTSAAADLPSAAEMILVGDFDGITQGVSTVGTYWDTGSRWTIAGGFAIYNNAGYSSLDQPDANMAISIVANTDYTLEFDINYPLGTAYFQLTEMTQTYTYIAGDNYPDGHYSIDFTSPADIGTGGMRFVTEPDYSGNSWTITNISLKAR